MYPILTDEQKRQFQDEGLFVYPDLFAPQEMDEIARVIEQYQARHEASIREKGGTEGISRADEITFTAFLAENDPALRKFATREEFVALSTQLLGPDTDLYWNQSVFKGPEGQKEFPWHQDDGYTPVTPSPYLTIWLALNDATIDNGCISALPRSHRRGRVPHRPSPIGLVCHESDDPDQGIPVPVPAGSAALFQSLTFHKSGVNRTTGTRKAYILQYSHAGLRNALTGEPIENRIPVARGGKAA